MELKSVRGMQDLYGSKLLQWRSVEREIEKIFLAFGYCEIRTPALEKIEVFTSGVGESTDIVEKQMFSFRSRDSEEVYVLRPEGTAAFMRAVIEHQIHQSSHPQRFYYYLPMFRYERPQKGRLRQFHQFGAELIHDPSPEADAEMITLLDHIYQTLGLREYSLKINSIGCEKCREKYLKILKEYFGKHIQSLCEDCQKRYERNVFRILDCKNETCNQFIKQSPLIVDLLCDHCSKHFERVKKRLSDQKISFEVDARMVRGLDYYSQVVFEFISNDLGSQSALVGGGRYDGLSSRYGVKPFPGVGFALGMERLMMVLEARALLPLETLRPIYSFIALGNSAFDLLYGLSIKLKKSGILTEMQNDPQKSLKAQMKQSDKSLAHFTVIVGDNELSEGIAIFKNMTSGDQERIKLKDLESELIKRGGIT